MNIFRQHGLTLVPFAHSQNIPSLPQGWKWVYFGTKAHHRSSLEKRFGFAARRTFAIELQRQAELLRPRFLTWLQQLGNTQKSDWWGSNTCYRSPLTSDLFLHLVFIHLLESWANEPPFPCVVFIEDPWVLNTALRILPPEKIVGIPPRGLLKECLLRTLAGLRRLASLAISSLHLWWLDYKLSREFGSPLSKAPDTIHAIVTTWLEPRSFEGTSSRLTDPYLGHLSDCIESSGYNHLVFALPFTDGKLLKNLYSSKRGVPWIHLLSLRDLATCFVSAISFRFHKPIPRFESKDVSSLLLSQWFLEWATIFYGTMVRKALVKLTSRATFTNSILFYPFENQPWEKMAIQGLRESRFSGKIAACHTITCPRFFLNYALGPQEAREMPLPDVILANGAFFQKALIQAGFTCPVENGGSLRFSTSPAPFSPAAPEVRAQRTLVLLSSSLEYSLDLLAYLTRSATTGHEYLLKAHPDCPETLILAHRPELPSSFTFISGTIHEWIPRVGSAIHIGTTAALECLMGGVNTMKYIPERIDLDPLVDLPIFQEQLFDGTEPNFNRRNAIVPPAMNILSEPIKTSIWEQLLRSTNP